MDSDVRTMDSGRQRIIHNYYFHSEMCSVPVLTPVPVPGTGSTGYWIVLGTGLYWYWIVLVLDCSGYWFAKRI